MASVENRVVSIKFNNDNFQKKISSTIKAIGELTKSLSFTGASKGFDDLSKSASSVDLSELEEAPKGISAAFAAMATVGITALANLTNRAVDAGISIGKAFTFDLVGDGFAEYELKMGSIQTIMAGTGESLDTVNGYLNDLNTYADRTIYSFADMTQNIGKFTNAGVSLETATDSIQGIANVAALAGSNSQQASNAMYNFSQALATGSVKLIDWKSIENAGLATVGFKEQLLEGAVAAGTLTKDADGLYKTLDNVPVDTMANFNTTLQEGWLSSEALTNTLTAYSDESTDLGKSAAAAAQDVKTFSQMIDTVKEAIGSGWASTFEHVVGDFEEGKELFTELEGGITGLMTSSIAFRNQQLQLWKQFGGRERMINGFKNVLAGLGNILRPISEAFRDLFPRTTGVEMLKFTKAFERLSEKFKDFTAKYSDKIKSIFRGIFSVFKIGIQIVSSIAKVFYGLFDIIAGSGGGEAANKIVDFAAKIGDFIYKLQESGAVAEFLEKAVSKIIGAFTTLYDNLYDMFDPIVAELKNFGDAVVEFVQGINFDPVVEKFNAVKDAISDFFGNLTSFASGNDWGTKIGDGVDGIATKALPLSKAGDKIAEGLSVITEGFKKLSPVADFAKSVMKGIGSVFSKASDLLSKAFSGIANALGGIGGGLESAAKGLDFKKVFLIISGALGAGLIGVLAKFAKDGFTFDFTGGLLESATEAMDGVGKVLSGMSMNLKAEALLKLAGAIAVMAATMILVSLIPAENLLRGGAAMAGITATLVGMMAALDKLDFSAADTVKLAGLALGFMLLSASMLVFGLAVGLLGNLGYDTIQKGLAGTIAGLTMLTMTLQSFGEDDQGIIKAAFAVGILSISLGIFAIVVAAMGLLPYDILTQGLAATTVGLLALSAALTMMTSDEGKGLFKAALAVGVLSLSLLLFTGAVYLMGAMKWEQMLKGMIGLTAALALITGSMYLLSKAKIEKTSLALLSFSFAMKGLVKVIKIFSQMSLVEMAKGLGAFGAVLLGIALFFKFSGKNLEKGSVGLLAVAGAMLLMGTAMKGFGKLSWEEIAKGLLGVIGALAIMAVAGAVMGPVVPVLIGLGAAFALMGAAVALAGVGILAFATAFQIFSTLTQSAITGFMIFVDALILKLPELAFAFGAVVGKFAQGFVSGWPELLTVLGELFTSLLEFITGYIPQILEIISLLISGLIDLVEEKVPEIYAAGISIIISILEGIEEGLPDIITAAANIIIAFIRGIGENSLRIIDAGFETLVLFLEGLADSIRENKQKLVDAGFDILDAIFGGMLDGVKPIITFFTELPGEILALITGFGTLLYSKGLALLTGLLNGIELVATSVWSFFTSLGSTVVEKVGFMVLTLFQKGRDILDGLWNGIKFVWDLVKGWFTDLPGKILATITSPLTLLSQIGRDLIQGLWNGIYDKFIKWMKNKLDWLWRLIPGWVKSALGINSPSKVMMEIGTQIGDGLGIGIYSTRRDIERASKSMSTAVTEGFDVDPKELTNSITEALESINDMDQMQPTITPVLDLSSVNAGAKGLNNLLRSADVSANVQGNFVSATGISQQQEAMAKALLEVSEANTQPREVTYEQNIYSPTALSTVDIYRSTRNQIALAKEELSIK